MSWDSGPYWKPAVAEEDVAVAEEALAQEDLAQEEMPFIRRFVAAESSDPGFMNKEEESSEEEEEEVEELSSDEQAGMQAYQAFLRREARRIFLHVLMQRTLERMGHHHRVERFDGSRIMRTRLEIQQEQPNPNRYGLGALRTASSSCYGSGGAGYGVRDRAGRGDGP